MATATMAPRAENPAAAAMVGRYPLVTAAGPARLPFELKIAVPIAMPNTAPNWRSVLKIAEALPSEAGATAFSAAADVAGMGIDTPPPARRDGGRDRARLPGAPAQ